MTVEAILGVIACVIVGIGLIWYSLHLRSKVEASANWLQAAGAITSAQVIQDTSSDSSEYRVDVRYCYVVNGQSCTGHRIAFTNRAFVRKKKAEEQLLGYPLNGPVTVFYDPSSVTESVLERDAPAVNQYMIGGAALLVFGLVLLIVQLIHG